MSSFSGFEKHLKNCLYIYYFFYYWSDCFSKKKKYIYVNMNVWVSFYCVFTAAALLWCFESELRIITRTWPFQRTILFQPRTVCSCKSHQHRSRRMLTTFHDHQSLSLSSLWVHSKHSQCYVVPVYCFSKSMNIPLKFF